LAKLDQIAVPDFQAGAMENWGAIIYRQERRCSSMTRPRRSSQKRRGDVICT